MYSCYANICVNVSRFLNCFSRYIFELKIITVLPRLFMQLTFKDVDYNNAIRVVIKYISALISGLIKSCLPNFKFCEEPLLLLLQRMS